MVSPEHMRECYKVPSGWPWKTRMKGIKNKSCYSFSKISLQFLIHICCHITLVSHFFLLNFCHPSLLQFCTLYFPVMFLYMQYVFYMQYFIFCPLNFIWLILWDHLVCMTILSQLPDNHSTVTIMFSVLIRINAVLMRAQKLNWRWLIH